MGQASSTKDSRIGVAISNHQLAASLAIYVVIAVVAYAWLEGPVGIAGTVDGSVTVIGLALGSILIVPVIRGLLRKYVGESESARLGLTGTGAEDDH